MQLVERRIGLLFAVFLLALGIGAFKAAWLSPEGRNFQAGRPSVETLFSPKEMQAFVVSEYERFKTVAKAAGIAPR